MTEYKRLELSWLGKEIRPRIEPRILLEDKELYRDKIGPFAGLYY